MGNDRSLMEQDLLIFYNCTVNLLNQRYDVNETKRFNITWVADMVEILFNDSEPDSMFRQVIAPDVRVQLLEIADLCMQPLPRDLVLWQKLFWSSIFALMLLIATFGNFIVMWIVLAHRRMRTVTNYFLVNLSVSDLLMSLLNCICNFIFMLNSHWPFGAVYCTLNNFVSSTTVAANVFTLMAISLDRYMAIVHPLHHRKSHRQARCALIIIWVSSGLLATPFLFYSTIMTKRYHDGQTRIICYVLWPDGSFYPNSLSDYAYNIVFLSVTYLLPMIVMAICYTLMGKELWGSRSIGELTQRQIDSMNSKKKVVRMFIFVVTIFAICWLPYHVYFIYAYHDNSITTSTYVQELYLASYWLAMSNAMVNPVIYYWMNKRFRVYFQRVICCCCKPRYQEDFTMPVLKRVCSQSDMARSRSDRTKYFSVYWRRRTQRTTITHHQSLKRTKNGMACS